MTRPFSEKNYAEMSFQMDKTGTVDMSKLTPVKPNKKRRNEEWEMQRDVFNWWRVHASDYGLPAALYFAIPNGTVLGIGNERYIRSKMLKLAGMVSGAPDTFLAVSRGPWKGLFVEYKTEIGVLSDEQKFIHPLLESQGYNVLTCRSLFEATEAISAYLNL